MTFSYCPMCGARLVSRTLGQEGEVPFCSGCQKPWFRMFPSAVCVLALNPSGEGLFVTQRRIPGLCLVSGFIAPGETAEETAVREVREETGLTLLNGRLLATHWYRRDGVLMHLILGRVDEGRPVPSEELTEAFFLPLKEAAPRVDPSSTGVLALLELAEKQALQDEIISGTIGRNK